MATYKVIQDIEAEDTFLGPLTLKQFIFGAITIVCLYLSFLFLTKGLGLLVIFLAPIAFVSGFLAFPWGKDQPTETWLLAKLRYFFKPRKRVWNQTGIQELVKITVPKKVILYTGDNLTQGEVQSRLQALATTVDTRGWAIKNISRNLYENTNANLVDITASDRLVQPSILPNVSTTLDADDGNDIFDDAKMQIVESQLQQRTREAKIDATKQTTRTDQNEQQWFLNTNKSSSDDQYDGNLLSSTFSSHKQPLDQEENAVLSSINEKKHLQEESFHNHKIIVPASEQKSKKQPSSQVTAPVNPATIELARNNDRSIDSIAREINQIHDNQDQDEVIVSLH